jgi:hypothetical protein
MCEWHFGIALALTIRSFVRKAQFGLRRVVLGYLENTMDIGHSEYWRKGLN